MDPHSYLYSITESKRLKDLQSDLKRPCIDKSHIDEKNMKHVLEQYRLERLEYEKNLHDPTLIRQRVINKIEHDVKTLERNRFLRVVNSAKNKIDEEIDHQYNPITRKDYFDACGVNNKPRDDEPVIEYCMDYFNVPKYPEQQDAVKMLILIAFAMIFVLYILFTDVDAPAKSKVVAGVLLLFLTGGAYHCIGKYNIER